MKSDTYNVVIIVLNYNAWQASFDYVQLMQNQQDVNLQFLIVDNCSRDGSYDKLFSYFATTQNVEVIQSDYNGGYAYGNNFGLKHIENKVEKDTFIVISNNDVSVDNNKLLNGLCNAHKRCKDIAFISPLMHIDNKPAGNCAWKIPGLKYDIFTVVGNKREKVNKSIYYQLPNFESVFKVDCLTGAFFMGKLSTFLRLAYFDERTFLYEEERILGQKVKNAGLSNYLALNLKFDHFHSVVIDKELTSFHRIRHLLHSRIVFHRYFANTNLMQFALLKVVYSSYLFMKRIQQFISHKRNR